MRRGTKSLVLVRNGSPSRPEETERYFPPATADSKSHRQEQTRVGSVSACILALFSPPGQWRSVNARTAPRLDQKLCGRHDRPVQSLSPLSLSFFVSRRARPIRPAPSRSLALSRAAALSFSLSSPRRRRRLGGFWLVWGTGVRTTPQRARVKEPHEHPHHRHPHMSSSSRWSHRK